LRLLLSLNAEPRLGNSVDGFSARKRGFDPAPVRVRFVRDKVAQGQIFLRVLRFYPVSVIPQTLHTHKAIPGNLPKINIFSEIGEHWIENSLGFLTLKG